MRFKLMELGGTKKDIALLVAGGISLALSLADSWLGFLHLPFDIAWVTIILCGIPILADALIGLTTRFDIKADVLHAADRARRARLTRMHGER